MKTKPLIVGNWKLNLLKAQALEQLDLLLQQAQLWTSVDLVVAPVVTLLDAACARTQGTWLQIAAQNVFEQPQGAYTGEWSVKHLTELGVTMVLLGHSERRYYFAESSELVARKTKAALVGGLKPIVCVGEVLAERETGQTDAVLKKQLEPVLAFLSEADYAQLTVAYEPVWAIGTGQSATAEQVEKVHAFLRQLLGPEVKLLYGGSVNADNAKILKKVPEVNGFLVGGASLQAESLLQIALA